MRKSLILCGGEYRNRTGVHGFAIRCVTTPPTRLRGVCAAHNGLFDGAQPRVVYATCRRLVERFVNTSAKSPIFFILYVNLVSDRSPSVVFGLKGFRQAKYRSVTQRHNSRAITAGVRVNRHHTSDISDDARLFARSHALLNRVCYGTNGVEIERMSLAMPDYAARRVSMVDTQVRPSDVTKFPIIDAMLTVPRERFVPTAKREAAYVGENVDLGNGRVMLDPRTLSKMLDAIDLQPDSLVLEGGTGLGYGAAVMARLAEAVIAVEEDPDLAAEAESALGDYAADNVAVVSAPLTATRSSPACARNITVLTPAPK